MGMMTSMVEALRGPILNVACAMYNCEVSGSWLTSVGCPENITLPNSVHVAHGGRVNITQPHSTNEASSRTHTESHTTLASLFFDRSGFEI